jgi:four helix bundle protein
MPPSPPRQFDLEDRLIKFADRIITTQEQLPDTKAANYLSTQLLRSGTSPALNYGEAQSSESKKDFIHKLRIVLKELRETLICLTILEHRSMLTDTTLIAENRELVAIFTKSVTTAKANS